MKEFFGADAYRSIVTQILPGLVASSTWIIALYDRSPGAQKFLNQSTPVATGALVLAAIFWGFVCEDLGSRVEVLLDRWQTREERTTAEENWFSYLRTAYGIEPVGIRYIRTLVTRMKFELNAGIALITAGIGMIFTHVSFVNPFWLTVTMWAVAAYLLLEGNSTVRLLRKVREEMRRSITIIGA